LSRAVLLKCEWSPHLAYRNFSDDTNFITRTFGFELGQNELPSSSSEILCPVCFCEYPFDEFTFLSDCHHGLCTYCFTGYL